MRLLFYTNLCLLFLLTGCSQEFPKQAWSKNDTSYRQVLIQQNDYDSRLELGRLNFLHNYIDEANTLLSQAVSENPDDMEAKAWYAANNCKIAGRKGPWLMGLDKLYGVWKCLEDIQMAVANAPHNFTVRMIQINTDAEVDMFGSRNRAAKSMQQLLAEIAEKPNLYDATALTAAYEAAARLAQLNDPDSPEISLYLQRIIDLNADADRVEQAQKTLISLSKK